MTLVFAFLLVGSGQAFAGAVFYDDFSSYAAGTSDALAAGWEEMIPGTSWGISPGVLWGNGMGLRMITDHTILAGDEATITLDRIRPFSGYVYSGDIIAWDGSVSTVLGSFSFDTKANPVSRCRCVRTMEW